LGINRFDPTNFSKFQHSQITGAHNAVGLPAAGMEAVGTLLGVASDSVKM
jgi:hypothetical protein